MPWTFAHPAAVLPLRRLTPSRLSFPALVVGSISPDLGYYLGLYDIATQAHTGLGVFVVCLPVSIIVLALFQALRQPICYLLPQPHRSALTSLPQNPLLGSSASALKMVVSVLLGAFTHIIWDSFTHPSGWAVTHLLVLQNAIHISPNFIVPIFSLLQHASTLFGVMVILLAYFYWLRKAARPQSFREGESGNWRYWIIVVLVIVSLLVGTPLAYLASVSTDGVLQLHAFIFRMVVFSTTAFVTATLAVAVVVWRKRQA